MQYVGVSQARRRWSALVASAEAGETIVITRRGKPVANLERSDEAKARIAEAIEAIRENRKGSRLDGLTIKDLINEGRKY